jgi:hypothetical protein
MSVIKRTLCRRWMRSCFALHNEAAHGTVSAGNTAGQGSATPTRPTQQKQGWLLGLLLVAPGMPMPVAVRIGLSVEE